MSKWDDIETAGGTLEWYGRRGELVGYRIYSRPRDGVISPGRSFTGYRHDGTRCTMRDNRSLAECRDEMRRLLALAPYRAGAGHVPARTL